MLTVACLKWGIKYGAEWVYRLRAMVAQHLSIPHEFVCFTDKPIDGVKCRALESGLTGWWPKLELLKSGQFDDWVLYLDLDVVVTASIDGIIESAITDPSRLWMRDDFSYSLRKPRNDLDPVTRRLLGGHGVCNSSVMVWHRDAARLAWDTFTPEVMQVLHGDQNHISRVLYPDKIGFLPDALVDSYKYGKREGRPIAPVMVFHGNPKMNELPRADVLRTMWEAAA